MILPASIQHFRELLQDIEAGRCCAPLDRPILRETLQGVLAIYEQNHEQYQRMGLTLERLETCIDREPEKDGAKRIVPVRMTPVYHSALRMLRKFVADNR